MGGPRLDGACVVVVGLISLLAGQGCGRGLFELIDLSDGGAGNGGAAGSAAGSGGASGAAGVDAGGEDLDASATDARMDDADTRVDADVLDADVLDANVLDANVTDATALDANVADANVTDANMDAGGCSGCAEPTAVTLSGTSEGALIGGTGGALYNDVCPENEVVIGYAGFSDVSSIQSLLTRMAAVCGRMTVSASAPYAITITNARTLPTRGVIGTLAWQTMCPPDQVVVGFDSKADAYFKQLSLVCAPLLVGAGGMPRAYQISLGAATTLAHVGGPDGADMPLMMCPAGQVVRGNPLRAGQVIDAFSTVCATPTLAYPLSASCVTSDDCDNGICASGTCAPYTCPSSSGCACAVFDATEYGFCNSPKTHANALATCASRGMRLVRIDSDAENGWIRSTATLHSIGMLQTGGDSLAVTNEWRWPDGALFWQGDATATAPNGTYNHWRPYHPDMSPACALMDGDAWWASLNCTGVNERYVCKRY